MSKVRTIMCRSNTWVLYSDYQRLKQKLEAEKENLLLTHIDWQKQIKRALDAEQKLEDAEQKVVDEHNLWHGIVNEEHAKLEAVSKLPRYVMLEGTVNGHTEHKYGMWIKHHELIKATGE